MYNVTVDLGRGYFEVVAQGFWTLEKIYEFGRTLDKTIHRIRTTGRTPVSLCDLSGAMVQSRKVVEAFVHMMTDPAVRSSRVAVYCPGELMNLQAGRASQDHDEFRFFADKDEARAWLFAPQG